MNLIQIQDRLKELPSGPQTMQLLMGYANGASPVVPPYLALGELQRRNKIMQEQASAQPPQGTVKDQIQQQASGIASLSQQGQAMAQAQMQPPQQATPQPQQQQQPPVQQAVQAARGGLLSLLARAAQAKRMNSGGVIAFNEAGSVNDKIRQMTGGDEYDPEAVQRARMAEMVRMRAEGAPRKEDYDRIAQDREFEKLYPDIAAAANRDVGAEVLRRLDELQAAKRAEFAKQREEAAAAKPSVFQMLGRAALGTRGQFGRSALGALLGNYEQLQSGVEAKALEQEQALRMRELDLQQLRAEAQNKYEEAQRAKAEGRMGDYAKAMADYRKADNEFKKASMSGLEKEIVAGESALARRDAATRAAEAKEEAAKIAANKPQRTTDQLAAIAAYKPEFLKQGYDDKEAEALALDKYLRGRAQAPLASVAQRSLDDAQKMAQKDATIRSPLYRQFLKEADNDARVAFERLTKYYQQGGSSTPTPAPTAAPAAAPAAGAKVMTRADIATTAKRSGKSEAEVEKAARAAGYTIQ